jgi:hypothetical protein
VLSPWLRPRRRFRRGAREVRNAAAPFRPRKSVEASEPQRSGPRSPFLFAAPGAREFSPFGPRSPCDPRIFGPVRASLSRGLRTKEDRRWRRGVARFRERVASRPREPCPADATRPSGCPYAAEAGEIIGILSENVERARSFSPRAFDDRASRGKSTPSSRSLRFPCSSRDYSPGSSPSSNDLGRESESPAACDAHDQKSMVADNLTVRGRPIVTHPPSTPAQ